MRKTPFGFYGIGQILKEEFFKKKKIVLKIVLFLILFLRQNKPL